MQLILTANQTHNIHETSVCTNDQDSDVKLNLFSHSHQSRVLVAVKQCLELNQFIPVIHGRETWLRHLRVSNPSIDSLRKPIDVLIKVNQIMIENTH